MPAMMKGVASGQIALAALTVFAVLTGGAAVAVTPPAAASSAAAPAQSTTPDDAPMPSLAPMVKRVAPTVVNVATRG